MKEEGGFTPVAVILPLVALVFHVLTAPGYGYFRDELYYLACAGHLDFGYVDHPPLIALITAAVRAVLGESLTALHLPPALAAAGTVWLVGAMARELGGGRFAQLLAQVATLLAPVSLFLFSILSMNAFEMLLWALAWWILIRILRKGEPRLWLGFGVVAGVGLENKVGVLFLGAGVAVGLLLTRRWEVLRSAQFWGAGGIAAVLFAPHLLWQVLHGWPTLEFIDNARRLKMEAISPASFLGAQVLQEGPAALPIWLAGLSFFLFARGARPYRVVGLAWLTVLAVMVVTQAKPYYLAPAYAPLFAGGGMAVEVWTRRRETERRSVASWIRAALLAVVVAGGLLIAPLAKPLLPIETYVRYAARLGLSAPSGERHRLGRLPQHFADMRGWPELAETVARVYRELPEVDRRRACIFGQNYGQAGAIDFFGRAYGLPGAISGHNSYYLWGPGSCSGEVVIVIGDDRETLEGVFQRVDRGATYTCADCMPYENDKPIWIAHGVRVPMADLWPRVKNYI